MKQYRDIIHTILAEGVNKGDRTGTGTRSIFGYQTRFDLKQGFPLVTAKYTPFHTIAKELFWLLSGSTNIQSLLDQDVHIWDEWADENGELGPVYGKQWRSWYTDKHCGSYIDQIQGVIDRLKDNPDDRRLIVSAWNVSDIDAMALPPCHLLFQFWTRELTLQWRTHLARLQGIIISGTEKNMHKYLDKEGIPQRALSCQLYQRSCDTFLGVPFNIASYALLTHLIAHCVDMVADTFIWTGGDVHLYDNHREQVATLMSRYDKYGHAHDLPKLHIATETPKDIDLISLDHLTLNDYNHSGAIKAPIAV